MSWWEMSEARNGAWNDVCLGEAICDSLSEVRPSQNWEPGPSAQLMLGRRAQEEGATGIAAWRVSL
jgi:hypothetical protein